MRPPWSSCSFEVPETEVYRPDGSASPANLRNWRMGPGKLTAARASTCRHRRYEVEEVIDDGNDIFENALLMAQLQIYLHAESPGS